MFAIKLILAVFALWAFAGPLALLVIPPVRRHALSRWQHDLAGGPIFWFLALRGWLLDRGLPETKVDLALCLVGLTAVVFLLAGCGYAEHRDPDVLTYESATQASVSAALHARDVQGRVFTVTCCGSMLPLIHDGDLVVVRPVAFAPGLLGKVVCYTPKWAKGGKIVHRLVSGDEQQGYIASGDNTPRSENWERVTAANLIGEVVGIYRVSVAATP